MLTIVKHPLIELKLSIMRNEQTKSKEFRESLDEIASLMCFEVFNGKATKEANANSEKWANEINAKIKTSGSDCHRETGVALGGIITKEPIKTNEDLIRILKSGEYELIKNQK